MKIIITGGAGYIGSHTLIEALKHNHEILVIDNLERGYKEALDRVEKLSGKSFVFKQIDLRNAEEVDSVLGEFKPECIIHFAAYKSVGESQKKPELYWENNVGATEHILKAMAKYNVKKIIFSSTAATYDPSAPLPFTEETPLGPISVYGQTKVEMEKLINKYASEYGFTAIAFRYFNAVGAHESGMIGEDPRSSTNLLPLVMQTLSGEREEIQLFGNTFSTADGSQERDYIHVSDLADAHIRAAERELPAGSLIAMNLATGTPTSCLKIFKLAEDISGKKLSVKIVDPREGDPERSFADNEKAKKLLNWEPRYSIEVSVRDQWNWTKNNPKGYSY